VIECALCRKMFDPEMSNAACASCTLIAAGCGKVKCPHCGYENQRPLKDVATKWLDVFRRLKRGKDKTLNR